MNTTQYRTWTKDIERRKHPVPAVIKINNGAHENSKHTATKNRQDNACIRAQSFGSQASLSYYCDD